ncbi:MAG TPA: aminoglycoside 3'-phosphotransferase [Acidimicrobiales bacterium]
MAEIAKDAPTRVVWRNGAGGLTFEVGGRPDHWFVKWNPRSSQLDLPAEAERLRWARQHVTTVAEVVGEGEDDDGTWLVTAALPGDNAVIPRWKADPATAVRAIGDGLRHLHDALPVATCPFPWDVESRLEFIETNRVGDGRDPAGWHEDFRHLTWEDALRVLRDPPPVERLVVCHGDTCAPNTLLTDDGRFSGHVDLGQLGTADPWADIAIATWSLEWNYGPGWEPLLLDTYGVAADPARTSYYRLLWELGP